MDLIKLSKFISLILRHKPEIINLKLDSKGYVYTDLLINNINENSDYEIDFEILKQIVDTDDKQRYSFNEDYTKIRANQGHSINVDVGLEGKQPPDILYHGTSSNYISSIIKNGINSKSRMYVHLSKDIKTAISVGKRHGKPVVLKINTKRMYKDGIKFYLSKNNVWLTKYVPSKYIKIKYKES